MRYIAWALGLVALAASGLMALSVSAEPIALDADVAFQVRVDRADSQAVRLTWTIAEGYYLYRDHTVASRLNDGQPMGLDMPAGIEKRDPVFGPTVIYRRGLELIVATPETGRFQIIFQGCKENAICYPPMTKVVDAATLSIAERTDTDDENASNGLVKGAFDGAPFNQICNQLATLAMHSAPFWMIAAFLMFGCITAFIVLR